MTLLAPRAIGSGVSWVPNFVATFSGAAAAGGVGLFTLYAQQRLKDRRKFERNTLRPVYSYVAGIPKDCPWQNLPDPPWKDIDPYSWQKIPAKLRGPLADLSKRVEVYGTTYARWFYFSSEGGSASFDQSVRPFLLQYSPDNGATISVRMMGVEAADAMSKVLLQGLVYWAVPYVLMNPTDPERAWEQLVAAGPATTYSTKELVRTLRTKDPATLRKVFDAILATPDSAKAKIYVEAMSAAYASVEERARGIRGKLARRLGFDG
jgi:hypothetical protein